ncbi:MAG: BCCT family transporter [Pseudomonadota bacterium]
MFKDIRPFVFWPPAVILVGAVIASLISFDGFLGASTAANDWLLKRLAWAFSFTPLGAVILVGAVAVSPLGAVRIGGPDAKPILSRWNVFAITLCTTVATGILFWGAAEPMFHFTAPPQFADAAPGSAEAARFALSTLYFHWTITPYAIYTVPTLAFALAYYNLGKPYSLSAPLSLGVKALETKPGAAALDAVALFALTAGVAASLGTGILSLVGGLEQAFGWRDAPGLRLVVAILIVATFITSSVTGLHRGIRILSDFNVRLFFALAAFLFLAGPTLAMLELAGRSLVGFLVEFPVRSVGNLTGPDADWTRSWTAFNFANWMAWAPITALFLGRIVKGYTVREAIVFNLAAPALFSFVWMTIFGGGALVIDQANGGVLSAALADAGPEAIMYDIFAMLPLAEIVIIIFVGSIFISFVTAMDSNTHSIASVCLKAARQEDEAIGAGLWVKIFWGVLIAAIAVIMTATKGVAGVKMLSNLGGYPALLILIGAMAALTRMTLNPALVTRPSS